MAGVAGAGLQKALNTSGSSISKDIDKTVADRVRGDQSVFPQDRTNLIASEKNTETKDPVPPPSGPAPTDGDRRTGPGVTTFSCRIQLQEKINFLVWWCWGINVSFVFERFKAR